MLGEDKSSKDVPVQYAVLNLFSLLQFIYERREPDFIKCSGSGNHSKLILHKDGVALKVFSSAR